MSEWEDVLPQRGSFIGWSNEPGQHITGKVLDVGTGNDMNNNPVPELTIELTEPGFSFAKGQRTDHEVGTLVTVTCGQANLKKNIIAARLQAGDFVKITLDRLFKTERGNAKIFDVKVRRGEGPRVPVTVPAQASFGDDLRAESPF